VLKSKFEIGKVSSNSSKQFGGVIASPNSSEELLITSSNSSEELLYFASICNDITQVIGNSSDVFGGVNFNSSEHIEGVPLIDSNVIGEILPRPSNHTNSHISHLMPKTVFWLYKQNVVMLFLFYHE
jgi:predicted outer membrane repeat protein